MNTGLPTGTVTFLFTDIEGSTRLWQQFPDAMPNALACHHAILNETIAAHAGYIFQIIGDAFCAAFSTATNGLAAALAAQRLLRDAAWGETGALRVRMALHTGAADVRAGEHISGEYVSGLTLSRAARLLSAGHGGQILLSLPTAELVRDHLLPNTSLRDLDAHRLKDLIRPEHIYQAVVPDLASEFPLLKTLEARPNNLPAQLTSFIGREQEMRRVKEILNGSRLVTLTGAGGSGKTRLALQVAADLIDEFPDGVWYIELAPLSDPRFVLNMVASVLGVHEETGRPLMATLSDWLGKKELLLVLDNCEHLIETCAQFADAVLRSSRKTRILATSREALGIAGESAYRVPSLDIPDPKLQISMEQLAQYDALQLFVERATQALSMFLMTSDNAPTIAQICYRLDGIPLAIELAAAQVRVLKVNQIAERLDDRFRLLTGGSRAALPRHQTLRALIDWSHNLLSAPERMLLQRLSVFAGGWTLEAAEEVCAGDGLESADILELLTHLVDKSLVVVDDQAETLRYRMLETIRQYSLERLLDSGESEPVRTRQLDFYLKMAEAAEPGLHGASQLEWLNRLECEHNNLRAALEWSQGSGRAQAGLRLAAALWWFWNLLSFISEGYGWLERALVHGQRESAPSALRARALYRAGHLGLYLGEPVERMRALCQESLELNKELGDKMGCAHSLMFLGFCANDLNEIERLYKEALVLVRQLGDTWYVAGILMNLGDLKVDQGDPEQAIIYLDESLSQFRRFGDLWGIAWSLLTLAQAHSLQGEDDQAAGLLEESLALFRELGYKVGVTRVLVEQANAALKRSNYEQAARLFEENLVLAREMGLKRAIANGLLYLGSATYYRGDYRGAAALFIESLLAYREQGINRQIPMCLAGLAHVHAALGNAEKASQLLGAAEAQGKALGRELSPAELVERTRAVTAVRAQLDDGTFNAAWTIGKELTLDQAIELAMAEISV